ncbi:hypothetical protein D3C72_1867550 [compost metagenome]
MRRIGRDEQRVAVGLGARHVAGRDGGVGAGLVFHHDGLAEDGRQLRAEDPSHGVRPGSRREGHDQGDRFGRVVRGMGGGGRDQGGAADQRGA